MIDCAIVTVTVAPATEHSGEDPAEAIGVAELVDTKSCTGEALEGKIELDAESEVAELVHVGVVVAAMTTVTMRVIVDRIVVVGSPNELEVGELEDGELEDGELEGSAEAVSALDDDSEVFVRYFERLAACSDCDVPETYVSDVLRC